jgi:hypothetical protein
MSRRYKGGVISATAPVPTGPFQCGTAKGIWTLPQQMQARAANIWPIAGDIAPASQSFTSPGTYTWVAPAGVSSVSVVVVGKAGNPGAALSYKNNISVTPGSSYSVFITNSCSSSSYFNSVGTVSAGLFAKVGDGGGFGGNAPGGGHGAGGYSGCGGIMTCATTGIGTAGTGGAGGGAGYGDNGAVAVYGGGGGVGLFGQGANGAGGVGAGPGGGLSAAGGGGGSGGTTGGSSSASVAGAGGTFGGGQGYGNCTPGVPGGSGLRIVWPGATRTFPSTNVGAP